MPPISSQAATAADFGPESVELPGNDSSSSSWVPVPCREDGGPSDQNPSDLLIPAAGRVCFGGALRNSATAMQVGGCGRGDG